MSWVQAAVLDWLQTEVESKDDGLSVPTLRSPSEDVQLAGLWTQRKRIELDGWAAAASGTDGLFSGLFFHWNSTTLLSVPVWLLVNSPGLEISRQSLYPAIQEEKHFLFNEEKDNDLLAALVAALLLVFPSSLQLLLMYVRIAV